MLQICWPVIMFESFQSAFKSVNTNILKYYLIEEQSSACRKGEYLSVPSGRAQSSPEISWLLFSLITL